MASRKSIASVLLFVGSTLCFFLPFVTVSCGGVKAFTLSGQQLATGTTLSQPQAFGAPQQQKVDADPFAGVAALCAIAGIAMSLMGRRLAAGTAASGGVAAVCLLILRSRLDDQIQKQGMGMVTTSYETGFTLAILLLVAGAGWNIYLFLQNKKMSTANAPNSGNAGPGPGPMVSGTAPPCANCGKPLAQGARFCESCGKPI